VTSQDSPITRLQEKILKDYERLGLDSRFRFGCDKNVPCFNQCCGDVNIFLTPYDVLRMKRALDMDSAEFLDRYTQLPIHREMQYPVVMFCMDESREGKPCHFVGEDGCTIYSDRPWPCRMYPLGLASPKEGDPDQEEFYFLMKEDVCQGFAESREWTVGEWLADQGIAEYEEFGRLWKELTLHEALGKGKGLSPEKMNMLHMACYDLDSFRRFIFESSFLRRFEIEPEIQARLREDDEELLRFAFRWVRFACFGEETMKIRPEALGPRSAPPPRG
jgi:Fe-S-cluster containining protein